MNHELLLLATGVVLILLLLLFIWKPGKKPKKYSYQLRPGLLTQNELRFYKALRPIATSMKLEVCAKVRLADIIEPRNKKHWMGAFSRIQAKHVDFLLCKSPLTPVLAIELDDSSHDRPDRRERDKFVDHAFKTAKFPILHVRGTDNLRAKISSAIKG